MKILACGLILVLAVFFVGCRRASHIPEHLSESLPKVDSVVEKLLMRYQLKPTSVATIPVKDSEGRIARTERRIPASSEFNPFDFNRALSQSVAEFGATAIATEKTEEGSVTMHIKKDGIIVQSLVFVLQKEN